MDVSRSGGSMYIDSRMVYLDYTPTFYPYIMVFESEVETGDSGLLNSLWFLQGYAESLSKSKMSILFDPDNKIHYKVKNLNGYDISISETPGELILTATNIPALKYEEYSPSKAEILPHVLLAFNKFQLKNVMATVDNWESFGAWMNEALLGDVDQVSPATIAKIKQLISNEKTNEAKARKIYQYVQDKVRYVSIQIGIGGWKPIPASEVDELSYGDCKALTNYTKVLLEAVGIPSYYTVVYGSKSKRDMDEDFASIQGNHVILGIPDGEDITWLECTSQDLPFGYIGSFTDDRNVVVITPEGGRLIQTKSYESTENTQETKAIIQLDTKGKLQAEFKSISKGLQYEDKYFLSKRRASDIDKYYKNRWNHINGFSIIDYDFNNDHKQIAFTENMTFETPNYITSVGEDFLLTPNIFNQVNYIPPKISERKQNLSINRGFMDIDVITLELPSEMEIETFPESAIIENKFGSYKIRFTKLSNQRFEYRRNFHLNKGEFPPEEYENYREFIRTISQLEAVILAYDFEVAEGIEEVGGKIFMSPLLFLQNKENPFKSETRKYPVDFGYPYRTQTIMSFKIPKDFEVESLPENAMLTLGDMGNYKYLISQNADIIQLSVELTINQAFIAESDYKDLKRFFELLVEKETEKVVFKRG